MMCRNIDLFKASVLAAVLICSCGSKPELLKRESAEPKGERVSVAYVKSLYVTVPVVVDREVYIEGYVVSDDGFGNFYKTIVVEDETGGIIFRADKERLCDTYPLHNKVRINCNSLTVGSYAGVAELGYGSHGNNNLVEPVPEKLLPSIMICIENSAELQKPETLSFDRLSPEYLSRYVRFENVQFIEDEKGLTWADEDAPANRTLTDKHGKTLSVRTSHRARFAHHRLPAGNGIIDGILGYFNGKYQLTVIRPEHAVMSGDRFAEDMP